MSQQRGVPLFPVGVARQEQPQTLQNLLASSLPCGAKCATVSSDFTTRDYLYGCVDPEFQDLQIQD